MDDESLNRDLRSALNVDPSPQFVARVRSRIAGETLPRRRWLPHRLSFEPLAALAVAGIVTLIVVPGWLRTVPVDSAPPAAAPPEAAAAAPDVKQAEQPVRRVRLQADRRGLATGRMPEVLVSADEQRALEFVAAMALKGRLGDLPVEAANTDIEDVTLRDVEVVPIAGLDPVVIKPLQIASVEGERQ